jgi:hypothetical protein
MFLNYLIAPSLNSLFFTGILLFFIFIIFIKNFNKINNLNYYQKIMLLSTITIAIGIHGLIHLGVEREYNFNPYRWF